MKQIFQYIIMIIVISEQLPVYEDVTPDGHDRKNDTTEFLTGQ